MARRVQVVNLIRLRGLTPPLGPPPLAVLGRPLPSATMPISAADLETAIRAAMPVHHLEIEDTSNGCGENYEVFVVSSVSFPSISEAQDAVIDIWVLGV